MRLRTLVWRELFERKSQMLTCLLAILLGTTTVVAIENVTHYSEKAVAREMDSLGANVLVLPKSVTLQDYYSADMHDEVIPEEFETSVEIFSRILAKYLVPTEKINEFVREIRLHEYEMFRQLSIFDNHYTKLNVKAPIPEFHMLSLSESSHLVHKTCADCAFSQYNIRLLAVSRDGVIHPEVPEEFEFRIGDVLFFLGSQENFRKLSAELL